MERDIVLQKFADWADIDSESLSKWEGLVDDAMEEIKNMLDPKCDTVLHKNRIAAACASLALYRYRCILSGNGGTAKFRAGEVTVEPGDGGVQAAYSLYKHCIEELGELVNRTDFAFMAVG